MIPILELKTQYKKIESELRAAVDDVLENGPYIFGPQVAAFEEEFAAYLGAKHAVGVGSGTEAINLALRAVGVRHGDQVITAANTCVPTAAGISAAGAVPVLVDIDLATCTLDPDKLEAAITSRTRAIVPVHMYGHPCDMAPILEIAARHKIPVVEDCAHAHGAKYMHGVEWRNCGTLGAAAAWSFYPTKNLGAYGDAGTVTTNDDAIAAELRLLRNYGEEERYYHTIIGVNSRLDAVQAAILRVKLRHLDEWNAARAEHAQSYLSLMKHLPVRPPFQASWARHVFHLFVIRLRRRDELQAYLKERSIVTLLHYPVPIHLQRAYSGLGYDEGAFPEAERACAEVISLPMYPELSLDHIEKVVKAITDFHEQ
jgi:dTDP-4-amino-4,6-dideoxygalactose transaminase